MEKLIRILQFIRNNHYIKDAVILLSGNGLKIFIGFILNMVLAKFFGAENFGIYLTLMSISLVCVNITDFGLGTTLNRLSNQYRRIQREIFSTIFILKVALLILFLVLFYHSIDFIAAKQKALEDRQDLLKLIIFLFAAESIFKLLLTSLQANHLFKRYSLLLALNNSFRLTGIIILFLLNQLTFKSIVILYTISFVILILGNCYTWSFSFKIYRSLIKKIFQYASWVWLFIIFNTLFVKSDILVINYLKYEEAVIGNYGLIFTFVSIINLLRMSIFTQLLPKTSKFKCRNDYQKYYSDIKYIRIGFVALSFIYILILPFLLKFLYQDKYEINTLIVIIFGLPYLFCLFNEFNSVLLYAIEKHRYITISNIFGLICVVTVLFLYQDIKTVFHVVVAVMSGRFLVDSIIFLKVKQCLRSITI